MCAVVKSDSRTTVMDKDTDGRMDSSNVHTQSTHAHTKYLGGIHVKPVARKPFIIWTR